MIPQTFADMIAHVGHNILIDYNGKYTVELECETCEIVWVKIESNVRLSDETYPVAWEEGDLIVWARLYDATWNGSVCPAFDMENVNRILEWNAKHAFDSQLSIFRWEGDTLIENFFYSDPGCPEERIEPVTDDKGVLRWAVGAWAWTWSIVPQPACRACTWSQVGEFKGYTCPKCGKEVDWNYGRKPGDE